MKKKEIHTARCDTILIQIYMDAPPGVPGFSKNKTIEPKLRKLKKTDKIEK